MILRQFIIMLIQLLKKLENLKSNLKKNKETKEKYDEDIFLNIIIEAVPEKIFIYKGNPISKNNLERIKIIFDSARMSKLK